MVDRSAEALVLGQDDPAIARRGGAGPARDTERKFAEVLAEVVDVESVSPDSHFSRTSAPIPW